MSDNALAPMVGETVTAIDGLVVGSDRIAFTTASGRQFVMSHYQDCCESVSLNEIVGNADDLLGAPLLKAEEASNENDDAQKPSEYAESWTWTFYHFATIKGYVTLRWLGESNGYYSESVDFAEVK